MSKLTKVVYGPGENGWIQALPGMMARVCNIPYGGEANFHDIVTLVVAEDGTGRMQVGEIVAKWFDHKTYLHYDTPEQYDQLGRELVWVGCQIEGATGPGTKEDGTPSRGSLAVAYNKDVDPVLIAELMGIPQPEIRNAPA